MVGPPELLSEKGVNLVDPMVGPPELLSWEEEKLVEGGPAELLSAVPPRSYPSPLVDPLRPMKLTALRLRGRWPPQPLDSPPSLAVEAAWAVAARPAMRLRREREVLPTWNLRLTQEFELGHGFEFGVEACEQCAHLAGHGL